MPRRRASKGNTKASKGKSSSSVVRWDRRDEIPMDEVDKFHEQRDKILLEGEDGAMDDDLDENEVFALKGMDDDMSEDDELEDEDEEDEDDELDLPQESTSKKTGKKKKKVTEATQQIGSSDESEEEESWGAKKSSYYSSNAAQLDSDDEEAHEMEENEARRLQAKQREDMREDDFGYSDALQRSLELRSADDIWSQKPKVPAPAAQMDKRAALKHLERTNSEALALAYDWDDSARSLVRIQTRLSEPDADAKGLGLIHIHYQTLQTYAALLAFYLHLRASPEYASQPEQLRVHPIMKRLVTLKQGLQTFEDLGFSLSDSESGSDFDELESDEFDELDDEEEEDEDDGDGLGAEDRVKLMRQIHAMFGSKKASKIDFAELSDLLREDEPEGEVPSSRKKKATKEKENGTSEKKRKKAKASPPSAFVFDLEEPTLPKAGPSKPKSKSSKPSINNDTFSGFGEATTLDETDSAEKGARKKALRFHTAKIESAAARRAGARQALGGDDDVPYKERRREKERRESEKKKKNRELGAGGDDLDGEDPEPVNGAREKRTRDDESEEDEDGYYSLVKRQKKEKAAAKKADYEEQKEANRVEYAQETPDGQRGISRAILKNKGLTPHRSKTVRNPRVKKRQKFEKAKKKLSSQKAIYKGGIGDANHYSGEQSGISKVVKSVRL